MDISQRDEGLVRFIRLMPESSEPIVVLLKGHLLIEETLREIVRVRMHDPDVLNEARLTFYQVLCLARAMDWPDTSPELWKELEQLNNMRNFLAHKLDPVGIEKRIDGFLANYIDHPQITLEEKAIHLGNKIAHLSGELHGKLRSARAMKALINASLPPELQT